MLSWLRRNKVTRATTVRHSSRFSEILPLGQYRPGDARVLGGDSHQRLAVAAAFIHRCCPTAHAVGLGGGRGEHRARAQDKQSAQVRISRLGDVPKRTTPPEPYCPGTRPSQAES